MSDVSDFMSHPHPAPLSALDEARTRYLRTFADVYFPQLFDLAISAHNDHAIQLLGFSARGELQTPKWSELQTQDFWQAMRELEPLLTGVAGSPPPSDAKQP
jgi:hypothetical protein